MAGVLAGCGGETTSAERESGPTATPTRAEYRAQVEDLCERHQEEIGLITAAVVDERPGEDRRAVTAAAIRASLPVLRRSFKRVRALDAPERDAALLDVFWRRADDSVRELRRAAKALERGDDRAVKRSRKRLVRIAAGTREAATKLGLTACMA